MCWKGCALILASRIPQDMLSEWIAFTNFVLECECLQKLTAADLLPFVAHNVKELLALMAHIAGSYLVLPPHMVNCERFLSSETYQDTTEKSPQWEVIGLPHSYCVWTAWWRQLPVSYSSGKVGQAEESKAECVVCPECRNKACCIVALCDWSRTSCIVIIQYVPVTTPRNVKDIIIGTLYVHDTNLYVARSALKRVHFYLL